MSKGDVNLQLNKKAEELNTTKTVEDLVSSVKTPEFLERPLEITERTHVDLAELEDKKWIKSSMKRLVKKNSKVNSDFEELSFNVNQLSVHIPAKSAFVMSHDNLFEDRISDKKKKEKKQHSGSTIRQKEADAKLLENNVSKEHNLVHGSAKAVIPGNADISVENYNDLAQFLIYKDMSKNSEISDVMLGGKNKKGEPCVDSEHAVQALSKMADQLLEIDISAIKLKSDHEIADNAVFLESIANRLAAFYRLSDQYKYMKSLEADKRETLTKKLDSLRDVAAYYTLRKEIIRDKDYIEQSGEVSETVTKEQKSLAEKKVKAYAVGKIMAKSNGISTRNLNKIRVPGFKGKDASADLKKTLQDFSKNDFSYMTELVTDSYEKSDEIVKEILSDKASSVKAKDKKK